MRRDTFRRDGNWPSTWPSASITHLVGLVGSTVRVTLEIDAQIPDGAPDNVVRTVTENGRTLKFNTNSGFEAE